MRKSTVSMILFLILLALSSSVQAQLYDNYLSDNQEVTINEIQFKVSYNPERKELELNSQLGTLLIPQGDARTLENKIFKFVDITSGKYHLIVDTYEVSTYIERTLKVKEVFLGNNIEVTVLIQNNGDDIVKDVTFSQEFEENKFISNTFYKIIRNKKDNNKDNSKQSNKEEIINSTDVSFIAWKGDLQPKEEITLVYYAIPITAGINNELELKPAKITYQEAGLQLELFSEKNIIRTKSIIFPQIQFADIKEAGKTVKIEPEYFKIGTTVNYKLILINVYEINASVQDFELTIPDGLQIVSKDKELIKKDNKLIWNGQINNGETKEFLLSVKADKRLTDNLSLIFKTPLGKFNFDNKYSKRITYDIGRLEPIIFFNKDEYASNDKLNYRLTFINPDTLPFSSLESNITFDFHERNISYQNLPSKDEILLADKTIQLPFVEKKKEFTASFFGSYTTTGNEQINFSKTKTMTVNAEEFDKVYTIDHLYYKLSNDSSIGYVFIKIDVKNILKEVQKLRIKTTYTDKFEELHSVVSNYTAEETAEISKKRPAGQLVLFPLNNLTKENSDEFKFTTEIQYVIKDQYYYQENTVTHTIDEFIQKLKDSYETNYFDIGRFLSKQKEFEILLKQESIKVYEEKTVSTRNVAIIAIIIASIIISIITANIIITKRSKSKYQYRGEILKKDAAADLFKSPKPTFDYAVLERYIAFCRQNNLSKFKIRQNLIKEGWLPAIIDEFLK